MALPHKVLIVDDEPDLHAVTRLSLKSLRYQGRPVEFLSASSGSEAVRVMRATPDVAVVLLDVVMESRTAGLDACREIREGLGNTFVRILLRTGQPGAAPERRTIDDFDIDGYLPKAELTSDRLYVAVRTAIKAFQDLSELDRHRRYVTAIHDCIVSLQAAEPLERSLERILATATRICPAELAVLQLDTFDADGTPRSHQLHLAAEPDPTTAAIQAAEVAHRIMRRPDVVGAGSTQDVEGGVVEPLRLPRELGNGWIYLQHPDPDGLARKALPMLAAQAERALYAGVVQAAAGARDQPLFDTIIV